MKLSKTKATINIVNVGDYFMYFNRSLTELSLPELLNELITVAACVSNPG